MTTPLKSDTMTLAPEQADEKPMRQLAPFQSFEDKARQLATDAAAIALLDPTPANAKVAKTMRLEVKPFRCSIERRYDELKRPLIDEGNRLSAGRDALLEILKPIEAKLLAIEQHAEREAARIVDERRAARAHELTPFLSAPCAVDLGTMTDDAYASMLADAQAAHTAKLAREQKEAEDAARVLAENTLRSARALEIAPLRHFITGAVSDLGTMPEDKFAELMTLLNGFKKKDKEAREAQELENARLKKAADREKQISAFTLATAVTRPADLGEMSNIAFQGLFNEFQSSHEKEVKRREAEADANEARLRKNAAIESAIERLRALVSASVRGCETVDDTEAKIRSVESLPVTAELFHQRLADAELIKSDALATMRTLLKQQQDQQASEVAAKAERDKASDELKKAQETAAALQCAADAKKAAAAKKDRERLAAEKKAAAAPCKVRLNAYADAIDAIPIPDIGDDGAERDVAQAVVECLRKIRNTAEAL